MLGCFCKAWGCGASCPCACRCPCDDQSLCSPLAAPRKVAAGSEVFVYHANMYNSTARPDVDNFGHYPFENISTVALYSGVGNTTMTNSPLLTCRAHSRGTRVVLGVGGQWGTAPFTDAVMSDPKARAAQVHQYVLSATTWGLDGLDLNVEYDGATSWNGELLTNFTCELYKALKADSPVAQLSFTSDVQPGVISGDTGRFQYAKLSQCIDFFTVLAYHEPLGGNQTDNMQHSIARYTALGVPTDHLVYGFAWFGQDRICKAAADDAPCEFAYPHCWGGEHNHSCSAGYSTIQSQLLPLSRDGLQWNAKDQLPYFYYADGLSRRHQVIYSTPKSIALRSSYVRAQGARGVGAWTANALDALDYPADAAAMWAAMWA